MMTSPEDRLEFRPATAEDVTWLTDVFVGSLKQAITAARGYWDEQRERDQFLRQLRRSDTCVICSDGARVGFYTAWMAPDHLFLGTLCVTPEHQNRGIGAAVMRALAVQANHLPVHLSVLQANPAARRFYERLGCRWVSSTEYHDHLAWSDAAIGR